MHSHSLQRRLKQKHFSTQLMIYAFDTAHVSNVDNQSTAEYFFFSNSYT